MQKCIRQLWDPKLGSFAILESWNFCSVFSPVDGVIVYLLAVEFEKPRLQIFIAMRAKNIHAYRRRVYLNSDHWIRRRKLSW